MSRKARDKKSPAILGTYVTLAHMYFIHNCVRYRLVF